MAETDNIKGFISQDGLLQLKRYQYQSSGYSRLDNLMNVWWNVVVEFVPLWVAPNLLTLSGLLCLVGSFVCAFVYSPDLSTPLPTWSLVGFAVAQFVYQTLDAIDGKQARRTGSSSPLGQLFDHGCDAIATVTLGLTLCAAVLLGGSAWTLVLMFSLQGPFFMAQWEEHHSHCIRTFIDVGIVSVGVTEGQMVSIIIALVSAFAGSHFWLTPLVTVLGQSAANILALGGITNVAHVVVALVLIINLIVISSNVRMVAKHSVSIGAFLAACAELLPLGVLMVCAFFWRTTPVFERHPFLAMTAIGLVFSHLTTQMIICNVTKMRFSLMQWTLAPLPVLAVISSNPRSLDGYLAPKHTNWLLYGYCILVGLTVFSFVRGVINQITHFLGIKCFSIVKTKAS